jgi:ketosteroid isomerase-like protein
MRGADKYRASWVDLFFPWHGGTGKFELKNLEVTAGASVGFAKALIDCAGTEAGRPVAFTVRLTVGLKKRDGAWLVMHEHHSEPLPFDRDAIGRAA